MTNNDKHMEQFVQYLDTVYDNANQHLLEQGRKRDQVITFYIVLLSFVLTNLKNLDKDFFGKGTELIIYIVLVIVGAIVLLNLADLRSWHTQYLDAIYTINWVMSHYDEFDSVEKLQEKMKSIMEHPINVKSVPCAYKHPFMWIKYWMFSSTDNTVYTGMILLTSLPAVGVFSSFHYFQVHETIMFILYGLVLIAMIVLFERYLHKVLSKGEIYNTWILSFDYNGKLINKK